jgi:hypothetical protein
LKVNTPAELRRALIAFSHDMQAEHRGLAALGEEDASTKTRDETLLFRTLSVAVLIDYQFASLLAIG